MAAEGGGAPSAPGRSRSRAAAASLLRTLLTTSAVLYLYFVVPVSGTPDVSGAVLLGVGLVVFFLVLSLQVRSVTQSRAPRLRALEVLLTTVLFLLVLFAMSYFLLARNDHGSFSQPLTRLDALYFTVTVFATVGFGDITATSETARTAVTVQMVADVGFIGLGVRLLLGAVQVGLQRQVDQPPPGRQHPREPTRGAR